MENTNNVEASNTNAADNKSELLIEKNLETTCILVDGDGTPIEIAPGVFLDVGNPE